MIIRKKDILVLGKAPTQGLDDTIITGEAEHSIDFSKSERIFSLSLHYNGSYSFLFVNTTKMYHFKAKDSEIKPYILCVENISEDFAANTMKNTGLNGYVYNFSTDYSFIDNSNIINIHKYLMKKQDIK